MFPSVLVLVLRDEISIHHEIAMNEFEISSTYPQLQPNAGNSKHSSTCVLFLKFPAPIINVTQLKQARHLVLINVSIILILNFMGKARPWILVVYALTI